jgi:hypothetical protein
MVGESFAITTIQRGTNVKGGNQTAKSNSKTSYKKPKSTGNGGDLPAMLDAAGVKVPGET